MVLRYLLHKILNNPQVIDRLAESYPIRRAAQLTAYGLQKGKIAARDFFESEASKRFTSFQEQFNKELKDGFQKINEDKKKFR